MKQPKVDEPMEIVTRSQWGARAPRGNISTTTWSQRTGVAIHHSATPTSTSVRSIQNYQMDTRGWVDIGYNWLVDQAGRIYEGRAGGWLAIGAHAAGQNTAWAGVCWIGNSSSVAPTEAALRALRWLYDEASRRAGRSLRYQGHGQLPGQSTECPGSRLRAWVASGMPTPPTGGGAAMAWDERIDLPQWILDEWPGTTPTWRASSLLRSTYGHARRGSWTYRIDLPDWVRDEWGLGENWMARSLLRSAYGHARRASERSAQALEGVRAVIARLEGLDTAAVLARMDQHAAEARGDRAAIADELTARLDAIEDLVRDFDPVERDATEVVKRIAEILQAHSDGLTAGQPASEEQAEEGP